VVVVLLLLVVIKVIMVVMMMMNVAVVASRVHGAETGLFFLRYDNPWFRKTASA
jgi:hypothetical protein